MSIHTVDDYGYYRLQKPEPMWMKHERYEYCEPFKREMFFQKARKRLTVLGTSLFTMLFHI